MTGRWRIRPARVEDVAPMAQLHIATWKSDYSDWLGGGFFDGGFERHVRGRLRGFIAAEDPFCRTAILECDGVWGGYVSFGAADRRPGEIHSMYLAPPLRGQGLGARMLEHAWRELARRRLIPVQIAVLENNTAAQCFYVRLGAREFARDSFSLNGRTLGEVLFALDGAPLARE